MKYLLDGLLPRVLPADVEYQTIPHDGKSALKRSLPNKLRGWNEPDVRFVVVLDQDNKNCVELKNDLRLLCLPSGKNVLIRIACQELESWYFGDMNAVACAYGERKIAAIANKSAYRIPDEIAKPKEELQKRIPEHQQTTGAKRIAPYMDVENNTSTSFRYFVDGVRKFVGV